MSSHLVSFNIAKFISLNNKIRQQLSLEDNFGDHLVQPLCSENGQLQQVSQDHV